MKILSWVAQFQNALQYLGFSNYIVSDRRLLLLSCVKWELRKFSFCVKKQKSCCMTCLRPCLTRHVLLCDCGSVEADICRAALILSLPQSWCNSICVFLLCSRSSNKQGNEHLTMITWMCSGSLVRSSKTDVCCQISACLIACLVFWLDLDKCRCHCFYWCVHFVRHLSSNKFQIL